MENLINFQNCQKRFLERKNNVLHKTLRYFFGELVVFNNFNTIKIKTLKQHLLFLNPKNTQGPISCMVKKLTTHNSQLTIQNS